jgi:hypothetical protein
MGDNWFLNSFYAEPPLTSPVSSADAVDHDSRSNRSKHTYPKTTNLQKGITRKRKDNSIKEAGATQ